MASTLAVDKIKKQSGDTFTLPSSDGSSGQFIKTDASGNLAFATAITSVAADTSPQLGGDLDLIGYEITSSTSIMNPSISSTGKALVLGF